MEGKNCTARASIAWKYVGESVGWQEMRVTACHGFPLCPVSGAEIYDKNATEDVEEVQASCSDAQKPAVLLVHEKTDRQTLVLWRWEQPLDQLYCIFFLFQFQSFD